MPPMPACFVSAADLGLTGTEMPDAIEQYAGVDGKARSDPHRRVGGDGDRAQRRKKRRRKRAVPFIGFVPRPQDAPSLSGEAIRAATTSISPAACISNGQPHRALPLTASLCMAVAARIEGSVVHEATRRTDDPESRDPHRHALGHADGGGDGAARKTAQWHAEQGAFYRTQRRLFEGYVLVRASRVPGLVAATGGKRKAA